MSLVSSKSAISLRKVDLQTEKAFAIGAKRIVFATLATLGDTGINLNSLTTPSSAMPQFVQATTTDLNAAQLLYNKNNFTLISSIGRTLVAYKDYLIASNTQINFVGFTASAGEIFMGIIEAPKSGLSVVDAQPIVLTGILAAGVTSFVTGAYPLNMFPTQQVGAVMVFLNGQQQFRNTGNSSTVLDGNYYETGSTIEFNAVSTVARSVLVSSTGLLVNNPDNSQVAVINTMSGILDVVSADLAQVTGNSVSRYQGSPNYPDLTAFGSRVTSLETSRTADEANIAALQPLLDPTQMSDVLATKLGLKQYLSSGTYNGGLAPTITSTNWTTQSGIFIPYQLQDGSWRLKITLTGILSVASSGPTWTINGVAFKAGTNDYQTLAGWSSGGGTNPAVTYVNPGTGLIVGAGSVAKTYWSACGEVALASKPTWAY